jgi:hypothetical protein
MRKQTRPMRLPGLENVLEIRSGVSANLALLSDSTVVSWGIGAFSPFFPTLSFVYPSRLS